MIRVLDQLTIDKIAAGEVIEKPGSVVKELVENAIDSGATAITIEIKDGGLSFIRITDNGCGIEKSEVPKAFLRHATSKLITADDLLSLSSLGFRGEALSSIAAVSQVELITKVKDDVTGLRYQIHGGREIYSEEIGCPDGTTFIVRELFYNTPARKKFLKTTATEGSYIYDLVCRISMSHPEISFKFIMNGTDKLHTTGNGRLKDIVYHIYGKDITSNLIEINASTEHVKLTGYIAKPCISRGNRSFEDYYVNQRYIKSKVITKAIEDAYRTFVMIHKFPFVVLHFDVAPFLVDVNIHPAKMELKFVQEQDIYHFTYNSIRETLLMKELIPEVSPSREQKMQSLAARKVEKTPEPFEKKRIEEATIQNMVADKKTGYQYTKTDISALGDEMEARLEAQQQNTLTEKTVNENSDQKISMTTVIQEQSSQNIQPDAVVQKQPMQNIQMDVGMKEHPMQDVAPEDSWNGKRFTQMSLTEERFLSTQARPKHRLIGQVFQTYWLIEYDGNLFIMDQHAAHEKVNFERLMENYRNKKIYPQYLMPPAIITLSAAETEFLKTHMETFCELGYQLEPFGGREYKLSSVPANMFGIDGRELFIDLIGELSENPKNTTIDIFISKLSTMACKAAIKGNTTISFQEADALIEQLLQLENPYTCPHGRPTLISISERELEKKFKRIQD